MTAKDTKVKRVSPLSSFLGHPHSCSPGLFSDLCDFPLPPTSRDEFICILLHRPQRMFLLPPPGSLNLCYIHFPSVLPLNRGLLFPWVLGSNPEAHQDLHPHPLLLILLPLTTPSAQASLHIFPALKNQFLYPHASPNPLLSFIVVWVEE